MDLSTQRYSKCSQRRDAAALLATGRRVGEKPLGTRAVSYGLLSPYSERIRNGRELSSGPCAPVKYPLRMYLRKPLS